MQCNALDNGGSHLGNSWTKVPIHPVSSSGGKSTLWLGMPHPFTSWITTWTWLGLDSWRAIIEDTSGVSDQLRAAEVLATVMIA